MAWTEAGLERRARRAYEWARLRSALAAGAFVPPVAALGLLHSTRPFWTLACIAALTAAVVAFLYRGRGQARGARLGLVAGLVPFALPVGFQSAGVYCSAPLLCANLPAVCAVGGLVGGLILGLCGPRPATASSRFSWGAAATVAFLAGSVGCLLVGIVGLLSLGAGLVLGAAPAAAARAA